MKKLILPVVWLLLVSGCSTPSSQVISSMNDSPPKAVYLAQPKYPFELHKAGITGHALVECIVSKSGDVIEAHVISATHPLFGASAVRAMLRSKYTIPIKHGRAMTVRMQVPVTFDLSEEKKPNQQPEPTTGLRPAPAQH